MRTDLTFHELLRGIRELDLHVNYIQTRQHGRVVFDYHRPVGKMRLNTWSVSKSFVSVAAGIALHEGLITLDDKLLDSFLEYLPKKGGGHLPEITIRHLLTMTSGLETPLFLRTSLNGSKCRIGSVIFSGQISP